MGSNGTGVRNLQARLARDGQACEERGLRRRGAHRHPGGRLQLQQGQAQHALLLQLPVGGRGFDETICKYFFKDFEERYNLNVPANKKAVLKLMTEAEKLKKLMASNTNKIPLNIECFMDDKDVKGSMDRACFEELTASDLAQIEATLNDCLTTSKLKLEEIYSVEIVGGSSRIP